MAKRERKQLDKRDMAGLFVPAGLFIGMGIGFLFSQLVAGVFIGLGVGFVLMIIFRLMKK